MNNLPLYIFVSFVACVTPGSGVLYTITQGFRGGMRCALASPAGTSLGCALMAALSATGLGALIAASPFWYGLLQGGSALVLIWLGWQSWKAPALDISAAGKPESRAPAASFGKIFWGAVVLQASNVMLIVFLLSLMPQFIDADAPYLPQAALLSVVFVAVCFCVHAGYSFLCALGARKLAGPRFSFWLNHVSAVLFWLLAASVLWQTFGAGG